MNTNEPPRIQQKGREVQIRQEAPSSQIQPSKSKARKNAVPEEIKTRARQLGEMLGVSFAHAMVILRQGSKWPRKSGKRKKTQSIETTIPHMGHPWYWNQCIITQYGKEARAFWDWSCIWENEVERRKSRERYRKTPVEAIRQKAKRQPKNPKRRREMLNLARNRRRANNPHIRTIDSLRTRFRKFITSGKSQTASRLLGCSLDDFKQHLESQFTKKMNWGNYGSYWHIDHILPCSSFDHTDEKQISICWHYTNMRPLEAVENLRKGKSITATQMNLLIEYAA